MASRLDPQKLKPFDALDSLLDEARAGASDEELARAADVSLTQVRQWREHRGLTPDRRKNQEGVRALLHLGAAYDPVVHHVAEGSLLDFEVPQYVVREALDYTAFARCAHFLFHEAMLSPIQIGQAFGMRTPDVDLAIAAWQRHLGEAGKKCLGCDSLVDRRFGNFCSRSCHDANVPSTDDL